MIENRRKELAREIATEATADIQERERITWNII